MTDQTSPETSLGQLSDQLADTVATAGKSVVRVEARRRGSASGIAWSETHIVTADHVLERDDEIRVGLPDGQSVAATVVGRDPSTDIAVLKVDGATLTPIGRGAEPRVGNIALIVARPGGQVAAGLSVIGAVEQQVRTRGGSRIESILRVDATFYPGFSGGALVNAGGELLGLATSAFNRRDGGLALGLATVDRVANALISHGRVRRGYLGITSKSVEIPERMRSDQQTGLLVLDVAQGSPAETGGVLMGDILLSIGGEPIRGTDDLRLQLGPERISVATPVGVLRGGQRQELNVTIGDQA